MQTNKYIKHTVKSAAALLVLAAVLLAATACGTVEELLGFGDDSSTVSSHVSRDDSSADTSDVVDNPVANDENDFVTAPYTGGVAVSGYNGVDGVVVIPDTIGGEAVVAIKSGAFSDTEASDGTEARTITQIIVPDSVTVIERSAFSGCKKLVSLTVPFSGGAENEHTYIGYVFGAGNSQGNKSALPESLESLTVGGTAIQDKAFYGCDNVKTIKLTSALTVGASAFEGCSSLKTLNIPDSVTEIGSNAMKGCTSLTELYLPFLGNGNDKLFLGATFGASAYTENLEYVPSTLRTLTVTCGDDLPEGAFYECTGLVTLNINADIKHIGERAFYRCRRLKYLNITGEGFDGVDEIGAYAFGYCAALGEVTLSALVAELPEGAFYACSSLRTINVGTEVNVLPQSHTSIGAGAFAYCESLPSLVLPTELSVIADKLLYGCAQLTELVIPSSVSFIGDSAFSGCTRLKSVTVKQDGGGVSSVGNYAFAYCTSLSALTLPDCVTEIGDSAFAFGGIEVLTVKGKNVKIGGGVFDGCDDFVVDVPAGSETYENFVAAGLGNSNFKR